MARFLVAFTALMDGHKFFASFPLFCCCSLLFLRRWKSLPGLPAFHPFCYDCYCFARVEGTFSFLLQRFHHSGTPGRVCGFSSGARKTTGKRQIACSTTISLLRWSCLLDVLFLFLGFVLKQNTNPNSSCYIERVTASETGRRTVGPVERHHQLIHTPARTKRRNQ